MIARVNKYLLLVMGDITQILRATPEAERASSSELLPAVYEELRRLAAQKLALERPGQTLQATALVHEVWLRLTASPNAKWCGRGHFFAAAAEAMRRILIENARRKKRLKHGGQLKRVCLDELEIACGMPSEELLALDEALRELEQIDPAAADLVKLRFFGGLTQPQAAEALGVSLTKVERSWAFSRAWLFQRVSSRNPSI
jgi:RNA polymerase sigma factor (TIGR02999 family)